jgi:hypothetical protein
MKALLAAAKTKLQTDLDYIRPGDVYVTEDLRMIRNYGGYPAVALKDGGTTLATETADQGEDILTVKFAAYVKLHKPETSIVGDASASEKGLLDIAADIIAAMDDTFSALVDLAEAVSIGETEPVYNEAQVLQMITVTMRYTRWR